MSKWNIYSKGTPTSGTPKYVADKLEYRDVWMGEEYVSVSISSPVPLELEIGDYLVYRGMTYSIYSLPSALKQARIGSYGEAFKYENVKFSARSMELTDIRFHDVVLGDNEMHYTSLSTFSFYCETVDDLVDRLQANTNKAGIQWYFITPSYQRTVQRYSDASAAVQAMAVQLWEQFYGNDHNNPDSITDNEKTDINITVDGQSLWNGLEYIKNSFGLNFITRDRACIIGSAGVPTSHLFSYGKGNGLYQIERIAEADQQVVTKLFAYGSDKNLPLRYYATIGDDMPNNMAVNTLMLIGFPTYSLSQLCKSEYDSVNDVTTISVRKTPTSAWSVLMTIGGNHLVGFSTDKLRPFITSPNTSSIGVKEGDIRFTEENDDNGLQEVYPSIEGMTVGDVFGTSSTDRLDEILSVDTITDNGVFDGEGTTVPNFHIVLKNIGFDLKEAFDNGGQSMVISMKDGYCGGRNFSVKGVVENDNHTWTLTVERSHDEALDLWFPYSYAAASGGTPSANEAYQIQAGDHFVLTELEISDTNYIWAASVKALRKAITWLLNNDFTRFTYLPKIDEIFMAREHASAPQGTSMHDKLKAGDIMLMEDDDLNVDGSVFIDQITIKENDNADVPTYDIVLRNDKQVGTMQRIQNQLNSLSSFVSGGGGGLSVQQIRQLIGTYGSGLFLSKVSDDTAQGYIKMLKGIQVGAQYVPDILGEGGVFRKEANGKVSLVTDYLYARVKAYFDTIEVKKYLHSGGNRVASKAGFKCVRVEWYDANNHVLEPITENLSSCVKFRCYYRATDGDEQVTNDFMVGDLAYCREVNASLSGGQLQHAFHRLVIAKDNGGSDITADGEGWIDLSNKSSETITISGTSYTHAGYSSTLHDDPLAQDDIVQLGNIATADRQGAIIEFVGGTDAPSYQIYQGIDDYDWDGKLQIGFGFNSLTHKAYMNVYGDAYIGDPNGSTYIEYKQDDGTQQHNPVLNIKAKINAQSTIGNQSLSDYVNGAALSGAVGTAIDDLQSQIDGEIDTWFYDYSPVHVDEHGAPDSTVPLNVAPYSEWTTESEKEKHLGDIFYNTASGYAFRFEGSGNVGSRTYSWGVIQDSAVITALNNAAAAQDTADHKRRVFLTTPTAPYDEGDLWVNATGTFTERDGTTQVVYSNEILKCKSGCSVPRTGITTFNIEDWDKASKYTDDTYAHGFDFLTQNLARLSTTQIDGGLVLSSLIGLRDTNNDIQSGINGIIDTAKKGNGIAAWYGGEQGDLEDQSHYSVTRFAKSLFRFDGSGYLASGNITWDANGSVTIKNITTLSDSQNTNLLNELATFNNAFSFSTQGQTTTVLSITPNVQFTDLKIGGSTDEYKATTRKWVKDNYISISFFDELFQLYNSSTKIDANSTLPSDRTNLNIKAMFGFWTEKYISALGQSNSGGGGGGASTLSELTDVVLTNLANGQILKYDSTTHKWYNTNGDSITSLAWTNITGKPSTIAGYGITDAKILNGTITLGGNSITPLTSFTETDPTVPSWAKQSTKPSYTFSEIGSKPNTLSGYGITDAYTKTQIDNLSYLNNIVLLDNGSVKFGGNNITDVILDFTHEHYLSEIVDLPTTLFGYGIVDAYTKNEVYNKTESDSRFVKIDFFNAIFQLQDSNGNAITPNSATTAKDRLKILVGAYTDNYLSALGLNTSGGISTSLYKLLDVKPDSDTTPTKVFGAQAGYVLTYGNDGKWYAAPTQGGSGTVTQVNIGTQAYNPTNGIVTLPLYPTTLPASDVYSWAKQATKPTYSYSEIQSTPSSLPASDVYSWAKQPNKPSYAFSELTSHPTSLSGYGITDAYTKTQIDNLSYYNTISKVDNENIQISGNNITSVLLDFSHEHYLSEIVDLPTTLYGYGIKDAYTKDESDSRFIQVAFFNRLFEIKSASGTITPNDTTTAVASIKALVGLWTDQYLSALGLNANSTGGGVDMSVVWSALAGGTDEPINISHLQTALSGYALTSQIPVNTNQLINGAGYITSSALNGYATQSWVQQQSYATQTWVQQNYATQSSVNALSYINSISRSENGNLSFGGHNFTQTIVDLTHEHYLSEIVDLPNTLYGYGITDAYTKSEVYNKTEVYAKSEVYTKEEAYNMFVDVSGDIMVGDLQIASSAKIALIAQSQTRAYIDYTGIHFNGRTSTDVYSFTGQLVADTGSFGGALTGTTATFSGLLTANAGISATTGTFSGALTANSTASISGALTASSTVTVTGLLTANGNIATSTNNGSYIQIGAVRLVYDSSANAIKVVSSNGSSAANFYSTGSISALGYNGSSSGGGGSSTLEGLLDVSISTPASGQILRYDGTHWVNINFPSEYATQSWVNQTFLPLTGGTMSGNITMNENSISFAHQRRGTAVDISASSIVLGNLYGDCTITANGITCYKATCEAGFVRGSSSDNYVLLGGGGHMLLTDISRINSITRTANGNLKFSGNNFTDTIVDLTHTHRLEDIVDANIQFNTTYNLAVNDVLAFNGTFWTNAPASQMSDIRIKDIIGTPNVSVSQIANAPSIIYKWKKEGYDKDIHVGSTAQYWQTIYPQAVFEKFDGYLSMQYDVIALLASIATAKKVIEHENRISELERENAMLKMKINDLMAA